MEVIVPVLILSLSLSLSLSLRLSIRLSLRLTLIVVVEVIVPDLVSHIEYGGDKYIPPNTLRAEGKGQGGSSGVKLVGGGVDEAKRGGASNSAEAMEKGDRRESGESDRRESNRRDADGVNGLNSNGGWLVPSASKPDEEPRELSNTQQVCNHIRNRNRNRKGIILILSLTFAVTYQGVFLLQLLTISLHSSTFLSVTLIPKVLKKLRSTTDELRRLIGDDEVNLLGLCFFRFKSTG